MTQTSLPLSTAATYEAGWSKMARFFRKPGVIAGQLNSLAVSGNGSGMQVFVATGKGYVQGFYYENDAIVTLAIASNAGPGTRMDRVVLRMDLGVPNVHLAVVAGTPGGGLPALTQNDTVYEVLLANVTVAAGAVSIASGNVADARFYSGVLDVQANGVDVSAASKIGFGGAGGITITPSFADVDDKVEIDISAAGAITTANAHADAADTAHTNANTGVHGVGGNHVESQEQAQARVDAHAAAGNPHPVYATDADLATHAAAGDPHPGYATDSDLSTHAAASDPHPGYLKDGDKAADSEQLDGTDSSGFVKTPDGPLYVKQFVELVAFDANGRAVISHGLNDNDIRKIEVRWFYGGTGYWRPAVVWAWGNGVLLCQYYHDAHDGLDAGLTDASSHNSDAFVTIWHA